MLMYLSTYGLLLFIESLHGGGSIRLTVPDLFGVDKVPLSSSLFCRCLVAFVTRTVYAAGQVGG